MFRIVVAVTVQSVFRLEMHQNNFFYFFKIIFDINTSKRSKNIKTNSFYAKKNLNFKGTRCTKHALNVKSNRIHSNQYQNWSIRLEFIRPNFICLLIQFIDNPTYIKWYTNSNHTHHVSCDRLCYSSEFFF
jgi:hypothetical protein